MIFRGIAALFAREVRDENVAGREMERAMKDMLLIDQTQSNITNSAPHRRIFFVSAMT